MGSQALPQHRPANRAGTGTELQNGGGNLTPTRHCRKTKKRKTLYTTKAGIALSVRNVCEHLDDTAYSDIIKSSETEMVRIRSEEYEQLFYKLLHKVGYTQDEYDGDIIGIWMYHKYKGTNKEKIHLGILKLFSEIMPKIIDKTIESGQKSLDPLPFMKACADKFGKVGLDMAMEKIDCLAKGLNLSPSSGIRYTEWENIEELDSLFKNSKDKPKHGKFIDQRFIDYLSNNPEKIESMHWRKFEELTAEYFHKSGFNVEIGPGQNDDGVDLRFWKNNQDSSAEPPHCIVQCKRQKQKIEKIIIKGLHSDIEFEKADYGLIVTSSELSIGARKTIKTRGYPIKEINRNSLHDWLKQLRTPGSGIVRI